MEKALVTFIIPAYNAEKNLHIAVDSVLAQTFQDWRMIIIDDCSTDATHAIAENYAARDSRIKLLQTAAPSGGPYMPRKVGVMAADTKYVSPLDADDWIDPDYLCNLLKMQCQYDADIVYPTMYVHREESVTQLMKREMCQKLFQGRECVRWTLHGWRINCNGGVLLRDLYLSSYEKFPFVEGNLFYDEIQTRQLLMLASRVVFSPQPYHYFVNVESVSHQVSRKIFSPLENINLLRGCMEDWFGMASDEKRLAEKSFFYNLVSAIRVLNSGNLNDDAKKYGENLLERLYDTVNWKIVSSQVSIHYFVAMRLGLPFAKKFFRVIDRLRKR